LAQAGIEPSVGSRGDSYDNALAETINGLYKAELIHRRAPWKTKEALELATLEWVALKWTPNLGQVFKWDTVQRNGLPMTESKKRRLHPPELKAKLGLEALGGMKTINQIALEHDVHPMQVRQWKRDIQDQAKSLFEGKRGPQPVSAASSPDRLYGEIGRLKMELDWLKKKSGISLP
jgi:transposase-like protein